MFFMLGQDYLSAPDVWERERRWEMQPLSRQRLGFDIPQPEVMARHRYGMIGDDLFGELLLEAGGNPIAAFKRLLTERIPGLEAALERTWAAAGEGPIEAVLTWCNCPSLNAVATARGVRVVHLEMGPLRWPSYRPTAYLDFSGVNGCSEAEKRYLASGFRAAGCQEKTLWNYFYTAGTVPDNTGRYEAGLALQVEDDSNLVAFGHGFDNQSLIVYAHLRHPAGNVAVRAHPGSLFGLKDGWYRVDDSPDAIAFLRQCKSILTVNSSVGLEALLLGIPATALGDCSYRFVAEARDPSERRSRLAFYLFAYLVPGRLIFDPAYLRFRLAMPSEADIIARHIDAYGAVPDAACWAQETPATGT
jgi:hypothetical protein